MMTPEFLAAEVAYRTERLASDYRSVRRPRLLRRHLRLPAMGRRPRLRLRSLTNG